MLRGMIVVAGAALGCGGHAAHPETAATPPPKVVLAVMPAEAQEFPNVAKAVSEALAGAHVTGVDETHVWKASIDVVKLQIECDEQTPACYAAAGKELHADRLLFALIAAAPKKHIDITVTLFDVDASAEKKTAHEVFADEAAALAGVDKLVAEATQP